MAVSSLLTLQSPLSISAPTTTECLPLKAVGTPLLGCPPAAEWLRYMIPLQRAVEDASPYNRRMSAVKGRRGELCSPAVAAEYVPVKNVGTPLLGCLPGFTVTEYVPMKNVGDDLCVVPFR